MVVLDRSEEKTLSVHNNYVKVNPEVRNVIAQKEVGVDTKLINVIQFGSTVFNQVIKLLNKTSSKSMLFINTYRIISLR